jgi:hypothetical protein
MQEQIHIETLINEVEELYERLLDDRYALGEGRYAQMVTKGHRERLRAYQQRYYRTTLKKARRVASSRRQPADRPDRLAGAHPFTLFSR